jgi:hypothetical protein
VDVIEVKEFESTLGGLVATAITSFKLVHTVLLAPHGSAAMFTGAPGFSETGMALPNR